MPANKFKHLSKSKHRSCISQKIANIVKILCMINSGERITAPSLSADLDVSEKLGVCPQCGEKVVKADVGRWLAKLIESSDRIAKAPRISVPAIKFGVEEAKV